MAARRSVERCKMENDLIEEMRSMLPKKYRDEFDEFVEQHRGLVASEYQDTIDAMQAELDCASSLEITVTLEKVRDWFFDVLEMHKPMSDPRKIYEMVERALR